VHKPGTTRRRTAYTILLLAILEVFGWRACPAGGPTYRGRRLDSWLDRFAAAPNPVIAQNAWEAVHLTGTNGIPVLLCMLRAEDSPFNLKVVRFMKTMQITLINLPLAEQRKSVAVQAFGILGPDARAAVPSLIIMYEQSKPTDWLTKWRALDALSRIGPTANDAVPCLLNATTNGDSSVRARAITALGRIRAEPVSVVPALTKALNDPDDFVRDALGEFEKVKEGILTIDTLGDD
jgi:hypothetical protein